jgi:hypothetical protein
VNQRLDLCRLHILHALNLLAFDTAAPLSDRAATRELVLASLKSREIPPHDCRCAERLAPAVQEYLTDGALRLLPVWVDGSERILGDPSAAAGGGSGELLHAAYPGPDSSELVSLMLVGELARRIEAETPILRQLTIG